MDTAERADAKESARQRAFDEKSAAVRAMMGANQNRG